jgi:hypothetical protein
VTVPPRIFDYDFHRSTFILTEIGRLYHLSIFAPFRSSIAPQKLRKEDEKHEQNQRQSDCSEEETGAELQLW